MTPPLATLLFLHVIAAIVAFGPTVAFPIIAKLGQQNPQHGLFTVELSERIETRMVIPLALTMPVTGVAMIFVAGISPFTNFWLGTAIILYTIAILYAIFVQLPAVREMAALLRQMASGPAPAAAAPAEGRAAGGAPGGAGHAVGHVAERLDRAADPRAESFGYGFGAVQRARNRDRRGFRPVGCAVRCPGAGWRARTAHRAGSGGPRGDGRKGPRTCARALHARAHVRRYHRALSRIAGRLSFPLCLLGSPAG